MSDELDFTLEVAKDSMIKAITHLENELTKIRAGKANPQMLEGVNVDYYGVPTVINQMANVSAIDARTLTIQPWEKNMLQPIERAIINANLGVTPQNDGNMIRLFMPPLTEERRKEFVKKAYCGRRTNPCSHPKYSQRRHRGNQEIAERRIKRRPDKRCGKTMQEITDQHISLVEKHLASKEKEIMAV